MTGLLFSNNEKGNKLATTKKTIWMYKRTTYMCLVIIQQIKW